MHVEVRTFSLKFSAQFRRTFSSFSNRNFVKTRRGLLVGDIVVSRSYIQGFLRFDLDTAKTF